MTRSGCAKADSYGGLCRRRGFGVAIVQHWVECQSPLLNGHRVELAQKGAVPSARYVVDVSVVSWLPQALVAVASDDLSGEGGEGVFALVLEEFLDFGYFTTQRGGFLVRAVSEVVEPKTQKPRSARL